MFRVLLILLALLVSAPAAAMPTCHDGAPTIHTMPMEHHRTPDAAPVHVCVGCIPVGDWLAPRIAAPILAPSPAPVARIVALDLGRAAPPPLRPPRYG